MMTVLAEEKSDQGKFNENCYPISRNLQVKLQRFKRAPGWSDFWILEGCGTSLQRSRVCHSHEVRNLKREVVHVHNSNTATWKTKSEGNVVERDYVALIKRQQLMDTLYDLDNNIMIYKSYIAKHKSISCSPLMITADPC